MIYKKFEISLSQNGENILHIARNSSGIVIFRGDTLEDVKDMIDEAIENQEKMEKEAEELKKKKEESKANKTKKGLFQAPKDEEIVNEEKSDESQEETESVLTPPQPQKRITRGPDGKFISKSALAQQEEEKKKSFWDKLTS